MEYPAGMPRTAYFSMEFGLDENLPIYAGGLGILAGDMLKAAHDQHLPVIGIGILWREGYTAQFVDDEGKPYDVFPTYSGEGLTDTGIRVHVTVGGQDVPLKVWRVTEFGNVPLYLLDADVDGSPHSWITKRLYGGSDVDRVAQEIVLGIGGVRTLRKLGIDVDIYHFNEGHAVLAGIELLREHMSLGMPFDVALQKVRTQIVFTTHTPVMAGNEFHSHDLLSNMSAYNGLNYQQMVVIGGDPFGMTVAGLRLAQMANGVSTIHGVTAREMWADVEPKAPILAITNGIHVPTWQDERIRSAFFAGRDLVEPHLRAKEQLLAFVEKSTGQKLSKNALTVGFARRAAPYKRSDLILRRPDVIEPLLDSGQISVIFSGKAHPNDEGGKEIVCRLVAYSRRFPHAVAFLQNYNITVAKMLVQGSDVWLNNPRRPLEASGTSGMKAAVNGVLNLSTLDGWWPEGCHHGVNGWQVGSGYQGPDQNERDLVSLYDTLLNEVIPAFHDRDRWGQMMRSSIDMSHNRFSAKRMVLDYFNLIYTPVRAVQEAEEVRIQGTTVGAVH